MKKRWAVAAVLLLVLCGAVRAQDEISWSNIVVRMEELQKQIAVLIEKAFGELGQAAGGSGGAPGGSGYRFDLRAVLGMAHRSGCMANLHAIEMAKNMWAVENGGDSGSAPGPQDLDPYLPYGFSALKCPAGGTYSINPMGQKASCSVAGHSLETGAAMNEEELRKLGVLESGGMEGPGRGRRD